MKIESIIKRPMGHEVTLDKGQETEKTYHFRKETNYLAEVANTDHAQHFLSIKEGYRLPKGELASAPAAEAEVAREPVKPKAALLGSSVHPATFDIGEERFGLGEVVFMAFEKSGLSKESWNDLAENDRHDRIDAVLDELAALHGAHSGDQEPAADDAGAPGGDEDGLEDDAAPPAPAPESKPAEVPAATADEVEQLREKHKTLFGRLPPSNMSVEKLRAKVAEGEAKKGSQE